MSLLGVDIGTSSLKIVIVDDDDGAVLARAAADYPTTHRADGAAEQAPDDWFTALENALRSVPAAVRSRIRALGVDGHVPSVVLVDGTGTPVRPAVIWQDTRASGRALELAERLGDITAEVGTTLPWAAAQLLPQLAWLAQHDGGESRRRVRAVLAPKDYLNLRLTGVTATDPWSAKGMCDVRSGLPVRRLIEAVGWDPAVCPPAFEPWSVLGTLRSAAAAALGLPTGIQVATGWTDALAAILAVGAFESPRGFVLTGTSNIVGLSLQRTAEASGLFSVPAGPSAPMPLLYGPTQSGGETVAWWARLLGVGIDELAALADTVDQRSLTLPTVLPYLRGERAPLWDSEVRAVVAGLSIADDRPRVARSVLDGVALAARHVLEIAVSAAGTEPEHIEIGGHGASATGWPATWRGTLGRPTRLHAEPALSALGAAMLAAMATGRAFESLADLRRPPTTVDPDPRWRALADRKYERYVEASDVATGWRTHG